LATLPIFLTHVGRATHTSSTVREGEGRTGRKTLSLRIPTAKLALINSARYFSSLIGTHISSSELGSSFLYFFPNISKCGLLSNAYSEFGNQVPKYNGKFLPSTSSSFMNKNGIKPANQCNSFHFRWNSVKVRYFYGGPFFKFLM